MTVEDPTPNPVTFKDIPGFPGYRVGDDGTVWSCLNSRWGVNPDRWKALKPGKDTKGYLFVNLFLGKVAHHRSVHRLVLEAFVGPRPEGQETRHLNGIRTDNRPENLCWDTHTENIADKVAHGTDPKGVRHGMAKLDDGKVREIRAMSADGYTQREIGERFGVSQSNVHLVVHRKAWGHV